MLSEVCKLLLRESNGQIYPMSTCVFLVLMYGKGETT